VDGVRRRGRLFDRRRDGVLMVCVSEGRLIEGVRRRDGFWMVCIGEGRLMDCVRRLGTAFGCYASEGRLLVACVGVGRRC
jgi:hypothetical protein